jgi:hypothetical protein
VRARRAGTGGAGWPALAWLALAALALAASCRSLPADRVVQSQAGQETAALEAYALDLLDLRLSPDAARLSALRGELARAAERPGLNRSLQAQLQALRAEAALLAGETAAARSLAEAASGLSDGVEALWYVRAALQPDPVRRLALLEEGILRAPESHRLLCERGRELLAAGRYAEAAQDLDEGLRGLDPRYRELYGPERDRALSLAQAAREAGSSGVVGAAQSLEGTLTVRAMVERAFAETRLLSSLSPEPSPGYAALLPALRSAGLLLDPAAAPGDPVQRKAAAYFLWGIIARTERDPGLLTQYRRKYSFSPVPDVAAEEPWFDASLGVVEREVMDLPDGVNFRPDLPVSGLEYLAILQRLQRLYR